MVACEHPKFESIIGMARGASALLMFFVPLFLLAPAPTFAKDSWNINCGSNLSIITANGQTFEGDRLYVRTGVSQSREITGDAKSNISESSEVLSTMREFPLAPWKKSCYRIPVEKGTKVLVRTRHCYGNYDGLNSAPEFTVRFDTSEWCFVSNIPDPQCTSYCEVVYMTTQTQGTDICLIRTDDTKEQQSPFVSTIEVQKLPPRMYDLLDFSSNTLFGRRRFAFGANKTIGYRDDPYNREWEPYSLEDMEGRAVVFQRDDATSMIAIRTDNSPPELLFKAAFVARTANETTANLTITRPLSGNSPTKIYITMYFTEPLAAGKGKRVFDVFMGGVLISNASDPIQPSYGLATGFHKIVPGATNNTAIGLVPTAESSAPPTISGMEVFIISDVLNGTNNHEVEVLSMLQGNFTVLLDWTGDPCLPEGYNWEWVGCKYPDKSPPRINKLLLNGHKFSGEIPDFSSLDALEVIDLSNNSFTGKVPDFLATFPNLQTLDLSFNDFDSLPSSLRDNITLITRGNQKLEALFQPPPSNPTLISACVNVRSSKIAISILLLAAAAIL